MLSQSGALLLFSGAVRRRTTEQAVRGLSGIMREEVVVYYIVKKGAARVTGNEGYGTDIGACAKWAATPDRDQYEVVRVGLSGNVIDRLSPEESVRLAGITAKAAGKNPA